MGRFASNVGESFLQSIEGGRKKGQDCETGGFTFISPKSQLRPIPFNAVVQLLELEDRVVAGDDEGSQADDVNLGAFVWMMRAEEEVNAAIMVALVNADGDFAVLEFTLTGEHVEIGERSFFHVGDWSSERE